MTRSRFIKIQIVVIILTVAATLVAVKVRHRVLRCVADTIHSFYLAEGEAKATITPLRTEFVKLPATSDPRAVVAKKETLPTPGDATKKADDALQYIDIRPFAPETDEPYCSYLAANGDDIYASLRGGHLIHSSDSGETWTLDASIEQDGLPEKERSTSLVAITDCGTILVVGERRLEGKVFLAVWRKEKNADAFSRSVLCEKQRGGPPASISVGKLGVFFTQYNTMNVLRSTDDGLSWAKATLPRGLFKDHVHCVWAHPSQPCVYVSGGDAGPKYGQKPAATWDALGGVVRSDDFYRWKKVFAEQPGERIVPITGNQRKRFLGIELSNGGALSTYDDETHEVIFGRQSLGFLNFDTLRYTPEGLLLAGTYQYRATTHGGFGQAGEIWISDDEGTSFQRIRTAFSQVSALTYNDKYIFAGFGLGGAGGQLDVGTHILRFPKSVFVHGVTRENKVAKIVMSKTDQTLARELAPGECTHQVNMAPYAKTGIIAKVENACTLVVEGHAYEHDPHYTRDPDRWTTVETLVFDKPGTQTRLLTAEGNLFAVYRARNVSDHNAEIDQITFVGTMVK